MMDTGEKVEEREARQDEITLDLLRDLKHDEDRHPERKQGNSKAEELWKFFMNSLSEKNSMALAKNYLEAYIQKSLDKSRDPEGFCYDLFQDFLQGRDGIPQSMACAGYVLPYLQKTRNLERLLAIVGFCEAQGKQEDAEAFYFTLYEIFMRGEKVPVDMGQATRYLKMSIMGKNTFEKREALRNLYQEQSQETDNEKRFCESYEQVIEDKISGGGADYAEYLLGRKDKEYSKAMKYYMMDGKYAEAYRAVDIAQGKVVKRENIKEAVEVFNNDPHAQSTEFAKSLSTMQHDFSGLENLLTCEKAEDYWKLASKYTLFSIPYAIYRTYELSKIGLAVFAVLTIAACAYAVMVGQSIMIFWWLLLWTLLMLLVEARRRSKYLSACKLWSMLSRPHQDLDGRAHFFEDSDKILQTPQREWAVLIPAMLFLVVGVGSAFLPRDLVSPQVFSVSPAPSQVTSTQNTPQGGNDLPSAEKPAPPQNQKPSVQGNAPTQNVKPSEQANAPSQPEKVAQTDAEKAQKTVERFWKALSEHRPDDAYACLSKTHQKQIDNIDTFSVKRNDRIRVDVLKTEVQQATIAQIDVKYAIRSVDAAGSNKRVQTYEGIAYLVHSGDNWVIDGMEATCVENRLE